MPQKFAVFDTFWNNSRSMQNFDSAIKDDVLILARHYVRKPMKVFCIL